MISMYIHIPFCAKKCGYCSFPVIPMEKLQEPLGMAAQYKAALFRDIESWSEKCGVEGKKVKLKTIYFGGGTPLLLGSQYLLDIMAHIEKYFDISDLQELSIECNPYPYAETLQAVKDIMKAYAHIARLRFSFGIQSLDDEILQQSNRDCSFAGMQQFTQDILDAKAKNTLYNYDFISFGERNQGRVTNDEGRDLTQKQRLQELLASKKIDSFSLYTLELFPGAKWYHETKDPLIAYQAPRDHDMPFATSEDAILDQFEELKKMFLDHGYARYEISNYALPGKESIHNTVYRTMGSYIGIGLGAHGLIGQGRVTNDEGRVAYRTANTGGWKKYLEGNSYDTTPLTQQDIDIESFFLALRTANGIQDINSYTNIMHDDREQRVAKLVSEGLAIYENTTLRLTDQGMNVHHRVCDYLMMKI